MNTVFLSFIFLHVIVSMLTFLLIIFEKKVYQFFDIYSYNYYRYSTVTLKDLVVSVFPIFNVVYLCILFCLCIFGIVDYFLTKINRYLSEIELF